MYYLHELLNWVLEFNTNFKDRKEKTALTMSYMLGHLHNGWQVDQAILSEEDRVVVSYNPLREYSLSRTIVFIL